MGFLDRATQAGKFGKRLAHVLGQFGILCIIEDLIAVEVDQTQAFITRRFHDHSKRAEFSGRNLERQTVVGLGRFDLAFGQHQLPIVLLGVFNQHIEIVTLRCLDGIGRSPAL